MRLREEVFSCVPIRKGFTPEFPLVGPLRLPALQEERLAWHHSLAFSSSILHPLDGNTIGDCMPRHRHQEFIRFDKKIDAATSSTLQPHQILDNYWTRKDPRVQCRFRRNSRFHVHFAMASGSWLNMAVEPMTISHTFSFRVREGFPLFSLGVVHGKRAPSFTNKKPLSPLIQKR
jgi:hypothetical protein